MLWRDTDDGLCLGLVDARDLVQEHEGELVVFVGDLDHVAVHRVQGLRNIYRYLLCHVLIIRPRRG